MRVLIGTPALGGQLTTQYFTSVLNTIKAAEDSKRAVAAEFIRLNPAPPNVPAQTHAAMINDSFQRCMFENTIDVGVFTMAGESLLQRGRNHIAQIALMQKWDKLFFIDADGGWTWEQFFKVATAPGPITAGCVPLKTFPISLNYLPFFEDEKFYLDAQRTPESLREMKEAHGTPLIKVPFVGTAFLCIDCSVFKKLAEFVPQYQYPNPQTGMVETHWDYFSCTPIEETYLSEDWFFCHLARKHGFDVRIHADVITTHTGNWVFGTGQHMILGENIKFKVEDEKNVADPVPA